MKVKENLILVIFGASGDLTKRKLMPALYNLFVQNLLPNNYAILGVGRKMFTDQGFRDKLSDSIKENSKIDDSKVSLDHFLRSLHYISIDTKSADAYIDLKERLNELDKEYKINGNYIYYLSTPPSMYETIADNLSKHKLTYQSKGWKRLIVEKPFGYSLKSALYLNTMLRKSFSEDQIYRIDHYLGKETVQNILVTRFGNGIYEPIWNRNFIHHVEITSSESIGIEERGGYYDDAGALRDMIQNHLLQLVAIVTMEPPVIADSKSIRNEMLKVFQSLRPINEKDVKKYVVRGQYSESVINNKKVNAYRDETGVKKNSKTETYVAMKCFIDNWRWKGVPIYIRTGKYLPTKVTEIVIHFKPSPHTIFCTHDSASAQNQLILRIQPDEGILLKFGMKVPGLGFKVQNVNMDFHYSDLSDDKLPEAYERLLLDCMQGDSTLYARGDAVEETWTYVDPILNAWKNDKSIKLYSYPAGTWGPEEARSLFGDREMDWRYPCKNLADDGDYCEL